MPPSTLHRKPRPTASIEALEPRLLLAAATPSAYDQYLLELINRGRANPVAEAKRYSIGLNEGLAANTISKAAKQPLAFNPKLIYAARKHSNWMLNTDTLDHYENPGNISPGTRMSNAGYVFSGSWTWGENIAWRGTSGAVNVKSFVDLIHRGLFRDTDVAGRGHRINLMKAAYKEIGLGVVTGNFSGYNSVVVTEDFAAVSGNSFLTGVIYADTKLNDNFYTPGEGLGKVRVRAVRQSDNATFSANTWSSGGYSLRLPAGTYTVTASGGALTAPKTTTVAIGALNVKRDFV